MSRPTLLLADDHQIVAEGLRTLLEPEFDLVGIVADGRALVAAAQDLDPDVIVADISMPLLNGLDAIRQLKQKGLRAKVVFLTMHQDVSYAVRAIEEGASGYVLKHSAHDELITAIHDALKGQVYITPMLAKRDRHSLVEEAQMLSPGVGTLTPRQREVLQLLAEGHSAKEAAAMLDVSRRTVEYHKYHMMKKLELRNSAELIQYAVRHGIASL